MKLRHILLLAFAAIALAACNQTLAADITPPPNYKPPTAVPTLGPLYPSQAPDVENGKVIYTEKCAPCHGETGLGNGPQSVDLPVAVIPIGLPEFADAAAPAEWYTVVTQGRIDRFMPPFASLSDQERWDVVSYALTLQTNAEQIELGKTLVEENCSDCGKAFTSLEMMSALSKADIIQMIRSGGGGLPAFASEFTDEQASAAAAYIRTLTFAVPAAPVADSATEAATTPVEGTPQADVTPEPQGSTTETAAEGFGNISGKIDNQTGEPFPSDLIVTLIGYEHDGSASPQVVATLTTPINPDGSYVFENVEIPESRIFVAKVEIDGFVSQSQFAIVAAGETEVLMPDTTIYKTTTDLAALQIDNVVFHFDFSDPDTIGVYMVYSIYNTGNEIIVVKFENGNQDIPFIKAPANSSELGFQTTQDSAPFSGTAEQDGFYMIPTDQPYGLVAFTSIPRESKFDFSELFVLPVGAIHVFLPEGVKASGSQLVDSGVAPVQDASGQTFTYQTYTVSALDANTTLEMSISGKPKASTTKNPDITQNQNVLIGIGALGVTLILAGLYLYLRDRKKDKGAEDEDDDDEEDEEDDSYEDTETTMDAIIALDDLHRAGKISDEAYKKRRAELVSTLKKG